MQYIGEITTVKTNKVTGEVTTNVEYNTQLMGMFRNLASNTVPGLASSSNNRVQIQISDSTNVLNRFVGTYVNTNQTFSVVGTVIAGEYWPQYLNDTANNRVVFTFKDRFQPGTVTRTINTISLYAAAYGEFLAGLKLQTPCIQTSQDILDVYYKIYVNYDVTENLSNKNIGTERTVFNNLITRWFYNNSYPVYHEGTSNTLITSSGNWTDYIALLPADYDLRTFTVGASSSSDQYTTTPQSYYASNVTNVSNESQGTSLKSLSLATTAWVGTLINKVATSRWDYSQAQSFGSLLSATPILEAGDSRIQSVYLKSANSTTTNFAYLDPSTIGSSTASLVLNDTNWTTPTIPSMFKVSVEQGGNINTARYKVSMRRSFGFNGNFFNTEKPLQTMNNLLRKMSVPSVRHVNNTYNSRHMNVKRLDDTHVVSCSSEGITVYNAYTASFVNYDSTTTPSLSSGQIQDTIPMPDGSVLITTLDSGLLKLSADRNSITKFTGIGSGVNDNVCYAAAVKYNGDIWAMFEGGLCRYTTTSNTWTVYNSTSPITFIQSEYNPTWNNTLSLYCRKDSGGDEILLTRLNSGSLTWWSPTSPNPVNTTATSTTAISKAFSTVRADYARVCSNLPGTSTWFFSNSVNTVSRMTFGTNTATVVSTTTQNSSSGALLSPMMYKGSWVMRMFENPLAAANSVRVKYMNATTTLLDDANANNVFSSALGSQYYMSEVLDDYGVCLVIYQTTTLVYNAWLLNPITPLGTVGWKDYGWNATTSQWELDNVNSKPVHTALQDIPDGLRCGFTPTGTNDFITGERWIGYVFDGLHKDNSTNAVVNIGAHTRNSYNTTNLSTSTIPTSLGVTTENFSAYTLDNTYYSWNGAISPVGQSSNTVANSARSELVLTGDFTLNFYSQQFSGTATLTNSQAWVGLYERDAAASTKWGFRLQSTGYLVTEDDVARTTVALPGANTKYTIRRVGSTISYLVNDAVIFTSAATSTAPLRGIFRMPSGDNARTIHDMKVTYTESRPAIKIGNAVAQTGVFDSRYAMIEGWLTSPRTLRVTIAGAPATVITDPMIAPAAGQVLLLQKSGLLVFNTADIGKAVTCNALVLLET